MFSEIRQSVALTMTVYNNVLLLSTLKLSIRCFAQMQGYHSVDFSQQIVFGYFSIDNILTKATFCCIMKAMKFINAVCCHFMVVDLAN